MYTPTIKVLKFAPDLFNSFSIKYFEMWKIEKVIPVTQKWKETLISWWLEVQFCRVNILLWVNCRKWELLTKLLEKIFHDDDYTAWGSRVKEV